MKQDLLLVNQICGYIFPLMAVIVSAVIMGLPPVKPKALLILKKLWPITLILMGLQELTTAIIVKFEISIIFLVFSGLVAILLAIMIYRRRGKSSP